MFFIHEMRLYSLLSKIYSTVTELPRGVCSEIEYGDLPDAGVDGLSKNKEQQGQMQGVEEEIKKNK